MKEQKRREAKELFISLLYDFGIPIVVSIFFAGVSIYVKFDPSQVVIISCVGFLIPLLGVDIIKRENKEISCSYIKRQHFIDKSIKNADNVISSILMHFVEDCYNRCSNLSSNCSHCENFTQECNGLLRNYLYETCRNLQDAIDDSKKGKYDLNTNIEKFHTIAVEHLTGYGCTHYSVMQWLYPSAPSAQNASYDGLDYDFLYVLLQKITDLNNKNDQSSSYYKQYKFKIRWLFIGNINDIQNNYDYILWVIDKMKLHDKVSDFFDFYYLPEEEYFRQNTGNFNYMGDFVKGIYWSEPSIGIFGDYFMFVDADNKSGKHGTIYTKLYRVSATDRKCAVQEALDFFNKVLEMSTQISFKEIYTKYMALTEEHRSKTLKDRAPNKIS